MKCVMANSTYPVGAASRARQRQMLLLALTRALAVLAATSSLIGLLTRGGPGRQVVQTARGATVTLYGAGLYTADTWLIGAGNRGQDLAMLIFELPVLLLVLRLVFAEWPGSSSCARRCAGLLRPLPPKCLPLPR
jgi:hypothetical protein